MEALRIYKPQPKQEEFHACKASEIIVVGGVRSGKSICVAAEIARAATGQDPHGKYPDGPLTIVCVGRKWDHIGLVMYPLLFKNDAIQMIRDEETGEFRSLDMPRDAERKKNARPAQPFIPNRFVKSKAWHDRKMGQCQRVELNNGTVISFFSAEGDPPRGFKADIVWIDEDINDEMWVFEMQSRLADKKGRFIWSAMPDSDNNGLISLRDRAADAEDDENPIIRMFVMRHLDNPYIDDDEKAKNIQRWSAGGSDELGKRAEGLFASGTNLMYPTFSQAIHVVKNEEYPREMWAEWTPYVAIDPGYTVMTTLFACVPPDEKFILFFDELYIPQCNASIWADAFLKKAGNMPIYAGIIDMHGGTLRDIGGGRHPHELYSEHLQRAGFSFRFGGTKFIAGCDDKLMRATVMRERLHIKPDGTTGIKILEGKCPNLVKEIRKFRKKTTTVSGVKYVLDEPQTKRGCDTVQAAEYLVAYDPKYHAPPKIVGPTPWWKRWLDTQEKHRRQQQGDFVLLGPSRNRK